MILDIKTAFDKVWHKELLYKIKASQPHRIFQVKEDEELLTIQDIMARVSQGFVLRSVLYTIFSAGLPET